MRSIRRFRGWQEEGEIDPDDSYLVKSAGYLYHLNDDYLILSRDSAKGARGGVFYIPVGCIVSVKVL